ncbi:PAS domain-containing sensor histidine kinase [Rubinisphaera margarita]|uniref:PAS domain-containing sensor histidine kinase n=1 Tax=Rubinisphaera margarita TaxID=2909586 RepID=UPI001EE98A14|nr:PAS domain-containing sensor histidine kinase [Rubinisphaera margarita]MCG6157446.1 PAS domain S-box protein [Rubinisphaera margarita]
MFDAIFKLFDTAGFPPRWYCGTTWAQEPFWGWSHIIADTAIWGAYMGIPAVLFYFLRQRKDLPLPGVLWLFGAFIFCCGLTHLIDALIFEWPIYRFSAVMKMVTATVSWATVFTLVPLIPVVLSFRSPVHLEEVISRRTIELQKLTEELQEQIRDHERTSRELSEQKETLQLALAAGRMGTWDWDLRTNEVKYDPLEQDLIGFTLDQQADPVENFFKAVHPDDRDSIKQALDHAIKEGVGYDHEFRFHVPGFGYKWLVGRGAVIYDDSGKPIRMRGLNYDITDRKRAEESTRENERKLKRVLGSLSSFVCVLDEEGNLLDMNRYAAELSRTRVDEALGKPLWECPWWNYDNDVREQVRQAVLECKSGISGRFDLETEIANGERIILDFTITPLYDNNGQLEWMIPSGIDITTRKNAEETLRLHTRAIEFAQNGIVIAHAQNDQPLIYCNSAMETLTGYSLEELLGKNCRMLQGPETDPKTVRIVHDAVATQTECRVTILNYRKDGTPFWNDLHISPVEDVNGEVTHFVGVQSDVSERIRYEQRLIEARRAADQASQAKSQFLANMSHEIRTPMTSLLGCADMLHRQIQEPDAKDLARMIRDQGQMLLGILNDILDLSKIEAGKLDIHPEPNDVCATLETVHSLMHPVAVERGLELELKYLTPVPRAATFDPLRIRQIVLNLVSNALKFTEAGRVTIEVSCQDSTPATLLHVSVVDTGVGIDPENLQAIFEAFTQDTKVKRASGGTGLGLTISQKLAEMMDGELLVESEVNQGSRFTLRVPIHDVSDEVRSAKQPHIEDNGQFDGGTQSDQLFECRVLVAEDTPGIQFLLKRILADKVRTVEVVDNGQQAVDAVTRAEEARTPYDLILMDMQMPVMTGYEATRQLRSTGFSRPIIALTAGAMAEDRERCLDAGCSDYLPKPISLDQLMEKIHDTVQKDRGGSDSSEK